VPTSTNASWHITAPEHVWGLNCMENKTKIHTEQMFTSKKDLLNVMVNNCCKQLDRSEM